MGGDRPTLKKCFEDDDDAFKAFLQELNRNVDELRNYGIFFSFTTDPMLPETKDLTIDSSFNATLSDVPVKILTKRVDWVDDFISDFNKLEYSLFSVMYPSDPVKSRKHLWAFGFTLTGHDELEKEASTNEARSEAMIKLHKSGFKTFASIEPIIDFQRSLEMIVRVLGRCDLYKIGLMSGKKYDKLEVRRFIDSVISITRPINVRVYFKDSILKCAEINRESLPVNCVNRDYSIFKLR